jgi:hypothetical protein
MSLTFKCEVTDGCVAMRVTGSYGSRDEICTAMKQLKDEADRAGSNRAIFNLIDADGSTSDMDRFFLGAQAAQIFGPRLKVAVVFPAEGITKFGENVAVNRGAKLAVLPSEKEAMIWLSGNPGGGK